MAYHRSAARRKVQAREIGDAMKLLVDEPFVWSTTRSRTTERIRSHAQSRSWRDAERERMPQSLRAQETRRLIPAGCFPRPRSTSAPAATYQVTCRAAADLGPSAVPSAYLAVKLCPKVTLDLGRLTTPAG